MPTLKQSLATTAIATLLISNGILLDERGELIAEPKITVEEKIDLANIEQEQTQYRINNNRYVQIKANPFALTDGQATTTIDVYEGKKGHGYIVKKYTMEKGVLMVEETDHGLEGRSSIKHAVPTPNEL